MEELHPEESRPWLVWKKTYVSQWHLSKLVKRPYREELFPNCSKYIGSRGEKKLLRETRRFGSVISRKVGFMDKHIFPRFLKKLEGISANDYRNSRL